MALVVAADLLDSRSGLVERRIGEQPVAGRIAIAYVRVLRKHGPGAREITDAAIAEPAARRLNVHVLRDHEFRFRASKVRAVAPGVARDGARVREPPVVAREQGQVPLLRRVDLERDLESFAGPAGEREEAAELVHPEAVRPAVEFDRAI